MGAFWIAVTVAYIAVGAVIVVGAAKGMFRSHR
jgi:uncharacterized membrane protein